MLAEIQETRQIEGEGFRRWFTDEKLDLIIWYREAGGEITGFQLCYDKDRDEKALTWTREGGFVHERVDSGEAKGYGHKGTPIMVADGEFNKGRALEQFNERAKQIDAPLRGFVTDTIIQA